ncbi:MULTISPECIES: translational GTPase TypA [unclassified Devosia]|uniref:translational GTPase TypA n=1 Tax=unclassified Devosia TaxID=196773 RepID=UPI00145FA71D|nr:MULTISPECIES: translational GTPase TypA [unclassified Devosia]MBJ6988517.1 translational GTPase TypA [Devosia sp. MC521]MBJ7579222.1 translational GTPase TypA [Devosia sp. MC532]MBK1795610.1 translational GTPase TypA [Devosia sp. WQ 349K1]QMW64629.1 translational GTPase TypA [Devosia sp. MC521]
MKLRNIAIIAHVDHGKTTLIDVLLKQSGVFRENERVEERAMDSNDIERERGITILAKVTSLVWNDTRINIVDTPGHADFGGEVERILSMVDGVVLLVDAAEGPMPQTKFVLGKALAQGLRPIVAINKIDKSDERHLEVLEEIFDLFIALDATPEQLDFPVLYGAAKLGWMANEPDGARESLAPLLDKVIEHVPEPTVEEGQFRMLVTTIERNPFLGRILSGRVYSGSVKAGDPIHALNRDGKIVEKGRVSKVLAFRGLERNPIDEGVAGDIVSIAGLETTTVADTISVPQILTPLAAKPIDPPTLSVTFRINDGPLAGREGDKVQSRVIRERLMREAEGNVAIRVTPGEDNDSFDVAGRGELQLAVLIENMRREGFELTIGRPKVLFKEENGQKLEPIEEVIIDVDDEHTGAVVQKLTERKGELTDMRPSGVGRTRIILLVPTRSLIGYQAELLSDTRGTAIFNRLFHSFVPFKGELPTRRTGVLISNGTGQSVAFALWNLEDRGPIMIDAGVDIYEGMIVGEHSRENDLEVNALKGKQLTNIRTTSKDEAVRLTTPKKLTLEQSLGYIADDEYVEVTPKSIRLRKIWLDPNDRKRMSRASKVS